MYSGEQALTSVTALDLSERMARASLFKLLHRLERGELLIKEQGVLVERFGCADAGLKAEINILDLRVYKQLLAGGSIAAGETYADGGWESPDLTAVIRIFARHLTMLDAWEAKMRWLVEPIRKLQHWRRRNDKVQARRNIAAHYDLGNELYRRFLDQQMQYSSAIFPSADASLEQAQQEKLRQICEKLQLTPADHLLEIGTGWGGLAIYAARHYGCRVTTTTISEEQYQWAQTWVAREQLEDKITLLKQDYRELSGQFDKLVSIEMIEAVGERYLPTFFTQCSALLKEDGLMLLQSITISDHRFESYRSSVDFIQQYIFPGGFLPSQLILNQHLKRYTDMVVTDLHDIGIDYARTLNHWHRRFNAAQPELGELGYDRRFFNLWRYYFCYCEGGFLERTISTVQLLLAKPRHLRRPERPQLASA